MIWAGYKQSTWVEILHPLICLVHTKLWVWRGISLLKALLYWFILMSFCLKSFSSTHTYTLMYSANDPVYGFWPCDRFQKICKWSMVVTS